MPLFKVCIRGENFLMNLTGEPEVIGFHATYFVKAQTEEEAEHVATIKVRKNSYLNGALLNSPKNPNRLVCEEITKVWFRRADLDGHYEFWNMDKQDQTPDLKSV